MITLLVVLLNASAQYTTAGDGTRYTLQKLSEIEESGVEKADNGESGEFLLTQTVTIAAGDQFQLDEDATAIRFSSGVALTIQGTADFQSSDETTMLADDDDESAIGISIENTTEPITLSNIRFERVGLRALDAAELYIQNCTFFRHDGSQAAALYFTLGTNKAVVNECVFEECRKAAVGSSVSAQVDLTLTDCYLSENSTMNQNVPQINLSASPHIVIDNCEIQGTPQNNMVGGIGISNFTMKENTHITIANCVIRDNRYGIGTMGPMQISITSNQLIDNCHETNPMNGGSGISLYDPYSITSARISQNLIEGSLWGITVIGCKDVNIGRTDVPTTDENYNAGGNIFRNNGNGGHRPLQQLRQYRLCTRKHVECERADTGEH